MSLFGNRVTNRDVRRAFYKQSNGGVVLECGAVPRVWVGGTEIPAGEFIDMLVKGEGYRLELTKEKKEKK